MPSLQHSEGRTSLTTITESGCFLSELFVALEQRGAMSNSEHLGYVRHRDKDDVDSVELFRDNETKVYSVFVYHGVCDVRVGREDRRSQG